jgi:hypothetical protein
MTTSIFKLIILKKPITANGSPLLKNFTKKLFLKIGAAKKNFFLQINIVIRNDTALVINNAIPMNDKLLLKIITVKTRRINFTKPSIINEAASYSIFSLARNTERKYSVKESIIIDNPASKTKTVQPGPGENKKAQMIRSKKANNERVILLPVLTPIIFRSTARLPAVSHI